MIKIMYCNRTQVNHATTCPSGNHTHPKIATINPRTVIGWMIQPIRIFVTGEINEMRRKVNIMIGRVSDWAARVTRRSSAIRE